MRGLFGIVGLLAVVLVVALLAKKQLGAGVAPQPVPGQANSVPAATPQQQVQQFKNAVDAAVQQPRPMPDDAQ